MADVPVTWLGHASFRVDSPGGKRIYVDPWLGNPKCPDSEKEPERIDLIAITHGHGDHVGETVELSKQFKPQAVVANVELGTLTEWVEYYEKVLGFDQLVHFSDEAISTEYSALMSTVVWNPDRIVLKKYDPVIRKHVEFREER